ncbi:hypothetical protein WBG78_11450 [Chryseolinea sp. T2]|uniref:hypothetical protein n=1 Tax=Chryseolinea sp. T2 TaxID=3129255 RepID=UPI00307859E1
MTKTNLEQLLERYLKGELDGEARDKLLRWLQVMEDNRVPGSTFAMPDDERLYKLLISSKSTFEDIDAFRPYSFDPPSFFSNLWLQFALSLAAIAGMIATVLILKGG